MRRSSLHLPSFDSSHRQVYALGLMYQNERDSYRCARVFGDSSQLLRGLVIRNGERVTGWAGANRRTAANSDAVLDLGPLADLFSPSLDQQSVAQYKSRTQRQVC